MVIRRVCPVGAAVLSAAVCACGGGSSHPGEIGGTPGLDAAATDGAYRGDVGVGDDGSSADAGGDDGGSPVEGGEAGALPPACSPSFVWAGIARVPSIQPSGFDRFGSISPNGLAIAWTSSSGSVFVADRPSVSASFGPPAQFSPGMLALANDRVALADSGLKLIVTQASGATFVAFVRSSATTAWGPSLSDEFQYVAATIAEFGGSMSNPVVSADGLSLFYLLTMGTNSAPILYESPWNTSTKAWDNGTPLPNAEFAIATASKLRRPTGASADRRTLFFFDETTGKERAAWRASPSAAFDTFIDLPALPEAVPNFNCDTLFFQGMDAAGQGLFTALRQ
jgi:hypothetical protein